MMETLSGLKVFPSSCNRSATTAETILAQNDFPQHMQQERHSGVMSGHSPVAMCTSEKWTPSMLIVPKKGLSSWSPATTTEFHRGSILHPEASE